LPTREDADETGEVVWKWAHGGKSSARFNSHPEDAVAWHPLPRYTPPGPTDDECDAIYTYVEYIARQGKDEVRIQLRRWFADVTARIEREEGK
jgi:hypothetical protein